MNKKAMGLLWHIKYEYLKLICIIYNYVFSGYKVLIDLLLLVKIIVH